ncbi:tetratricopeptide repeat protein [Psychrosphaera algicola]|uniref:Tetratricopeptide repeat protein n=1 Tax=Psychrosphaera algicola TaxID=3023714 RepID=A0ABT5FGC5_9GAMM|nr:tetratricopeptide repeat protein [Psychrosphaera sp. G1-22]MDC2890199.1 tetratricopeptide repeat protein [Psychrosphaera sp. G1-22]
MGLYDDAKNYFQVLIEEDPEQARPYLDLAIIHQYLGEFDLAEDIYERVLDLNSLEPDVHKKY